MKISIPNPALPLGDELEEAIRTVAVELSVSRNEVLKLIVREWLEQNAYLPVREKDVDGDVLGHA